MKRRKTIACISIRPEEVYQQRVMEGLQAQCEKYGYNLAVFSPLVDITHYFKDYLSGELNILNLPDFSKFDAVIIVSIPFLASGDDVFIKKFLDKIKSTADIPVISLDYSVEGCIPVYTDDINAFYLITKHLLEVHSCKKVYMLTGHKENEVSERRIAGYRKAMEENGIALNDDYIFYGDFWYTSGEAFAEKLLSGEITMPEAVVCAGDHMAIGLVNILEKAGIKVPEQIMVTGYEATYEAITNCTGITSYISDVNNMAANAIDKIKELIEPERPLIPHSFKNNTGLFIGESCGCKVNSKLQKQYLQSALYRTNRNYSDKGISNNEDISNLLESYMLETLTKSESPLECLKLIYASTYLIMPYDHFYLCLRPDWLDTETNCNDGYPETMRCVMHAAPETSENNVENIIHCRNADRDNFDTSLMLPDLWLDYDKPQVFYFSPCHFSDNTLGYSVLQCELKNNQKITCVFHNWLRNVNNALEMIRARNKLISYSLIDSMTKLCNRRGMTIRINDLLSIAEPDDKALAMVIDMDGLKPINDTHGHNEGDYAIMTVASVVRCITEGCEVSSRAGGDEFYILGVGKYTEESIRKRVDHFYSILAEQNKCSLKPYEITASVGWSIKPVNEFKDISEIIADADSKMYSSKIERKKKRK